MSLLTWQVSRNCWCLFATVMKENFTRTCCSALQWKEGVPPVTFFNCLNGWMEDAGLQWANCLSICTDGAAAMLGKNKGLKAKVLSVAPHAKFTHCIIHREALASKTLEPELNNVLQTAIQMVNFIKSRPLNTRLFTLLCQEMGSSHESLLIHSEVRCLSQGKVLTRLWVAKRGAHLPLRHKLRFCTPSHWLGMDSPSCLFVMHIRQIKYAQHVTTRP